MMKAKRYIGVSLLAVLLLAACKEKELEPTDVVINDPYRHYYPVIQGEVLPVIYELENPSKVPLVIQEVQTSCGCLIPSDELPIIILPGKKGRVRLAYNTIKNTGEVKHQVYLYGNFTDSIYRLMTFDTNVVPPSDYTRDYEELYNQEVEGGGKTTITDLVDGNSNQKGYYTDEKGDIRDNTLKERQEKADQILDFVRGKK